MPPYMKFQHQPKAKSFTLYMYFVIINKTGQLIVGCHCWKRWCVGRMCHWNKSNLKMTKNLDKSEMRS